MLSTAPLFQVSNIVYNKAADMAYFWGDNVFYGLDLSVDLPVSTPLMGSPVVDFAVTPDGGLFAVPYIEDIVLVSPGYSDFIILPAGLSITNRHDALFAPTSQTCGCSLYVPEGDKIYELSGFDGPCKPFPWTVYMPAIIKH